jgi:hypothetical protein
LLPNFATRAAGTSPCGGAHLGIRIELYRVLVGAQGALVVIFGDADTLLGFHAFGRDTPGRLSDQARRKGDIVVGIAHIVCLIAHRCGMRRVNTWLSDRAVHPFPSIGIGCMKAALVRRRVLSHQVTPLMQRCRLRVERIVRGLLSGNLGSRFGSRSGILVGRVGQVRDR